MSNLDDFFKKRDKKKKTTKSKFLTLDTDELAKNLEATAIKGGDEETDLQDNNNNLTNNNLVVNDNLDEEWKPYEDENKDLTGLKITFLKQVEDENNDYLGVIDENEKKSACPWGAVCMTAQNKQTDESKDDLVSEPSNVKQTALSDSTNQQTNTDIQKSSSTTQIAATSDSTTASSTTTTTNTATTATSSTSSSAYVPPALRRQQQPSDNKPAPTTDSAGKYVPPSMRNKQAETTIPTTTTTTTRRGNKSQPNINDTMEFPTLDASGSDNVAQTEKTSNAPGERFEIAKKGARIETKADGGMINLANKFTALSSNN